jgi:flavorubredoxin
MAKVLVIYHSQSGNTEAMAKAVAEGAKSAGATVVLKKATEANAEDLLACDVVAIGTPNYFGYMAGLVKDYFDRAWLVIRDKVADKPYATFGSKGGGGAQALETVENICNGLKMRKVLDGVMATRQPSETVIGECKEMGMKLAKPEKLKAVGVKEPRL